MKKNNVTAATVAAWIKNGGGATLDRGGWPVDFCRGYQVSREDCYTIRAGAYRKIAAAVRDVLARLQPGDFCGLWRGDDGRVCVDVSIRIGNRAEAEKLGRAWNQKAIFSWARKTNIFLT